ncbi:MAG: hypothetical protein M1360_00400 [Candidatus Marsarchaeota archaeon]|jgi:hypothetical protein|nr:hypothetical protein [Candidatus Marsarchaeota archaeon]MCL5418385.1 hypothetical protein [Candidatus Marsarchaeota archaeon]
MTASISIETKDCVKEAREDFGLLGINRDYAKNREMSNMLRTETSKQDNEKASITNKKQEKEDNQDEDDLFISTVKNNI